MRFAISYNAASHVLFTILGVPQESAYVDVGNDRIMARLGWLGHITMPRDAIAGVERVNRIPLGLGMGMHSTLRGTWAINGANTGAVRITMARPATGQTLVFPIHPTTVYLSLDDPDVFIAAVR